MRTHVRIHFDRRNAEFCEDNYITCILGNELGIGSASNVTSSPAEVDQIFKSLGIAPEACNKALATPSAEGSVTALLSPKSNRELGSTSLAGLQFLQLAQRLANHSPGPTTGAGCRSDKLFLCDLCCYSSSYRGNVIRHSKLVHGREISDVAVVSSNFLQQQQQSPKPSSGGSTGADCGRMKSSESPPRVTIAAVAVTAAPEASMLITASETKPLLGADPMSPVEESIQVKIDPDDVAIYQQMSPSPQPSPLPERPGSVLNAIDTSSDTITVPKHCKTCNITFTYMSTFLAHKKYYCSSHTANASVVPPEVTQTWTYP